MLFSTKDHCCQIFSADGTWRFLAEKGNKFYHTGGGASNRGFLTRLVFGSVSSMTTGLEKAMKEAFTAENGCGSLTQGHSKTGSDSVL
ncbi:hypothetical protein GYH30_011852 [Glycine max]|nr:hypothetical protein GYH30_011852 [Glycine max]